ncbi:MAG TPA: hypothetical protein VKT29_14850 [Terriglobales bacterium]|nr:hypothetical protein [Terriglobales bacterium]
MRLSWYLVLLLGLLPRAQAQTQLRPAVDPRIGRANFAAPTLTALASRAGYIVAGKVIRVQRIPPQESGGIATVRATLQVEQALKGVRAGTRFTFTQWAGAGQDYREGERVLLFLYPRSKAGLNSPVGGDWGRFQLNAGNVVLGRARARAFFGQATLSLPASQPATPLPEVMSLADFTAQVKKAIPRPAR